MPDRTATFRDLARTAGRYRGLVLPVGAAMLLFVVLVPLPPAMVDVLLAANITLGAVVLLTAISVPSPLEFSVFPSILLGATLFRLVLNVATTRLILTAGAGGRPPAAAATAAGQVIWSFSEFVTRGSLAVGVILFVILVVVQFVVVTKGAARISEVAARFVLDAMPGKQAAIDSELASGMIDESAARRRRDRITREADLYGAMDGASKFLRGDAVAAALITLINFLGGLYVGLVQYGWSFGETTSLFARLTIGDGLAAQVPAFLVSISAALIVTRSTARTDLGEEVVSQLTGRPVVLVITAAFLAALALTDLPKAPLLLLGVGCVGLAVLLHRSRAAGNAEGDPAEPPAAVEAAPSPTGGREIEHVLAVEPLSVELGYGLVRLVDASAGGDLSDRITALRRRIAREMGLVAPPVRIRDNLALDARGYVIRVRGAKVASGRLYPNQLLAVGGSKTTGKVLGREAVEPAFGSPAVWVSSAQREHAERMNYTVVEPASVLATHLAEVVRRHAHELLSRQRVAEILDGLRGSAAQLVDDVTARLDVGRVRKVLARLLAERVPIRDMEAILEALCEAAERTDDVARLTEAVRARLGRTLSQQYCDEDGRLWCVCLDAEAEDALRRLADADRPDLRADGDMARRLADALDEPLAELRTQGRPPVVVCSPEVRPAVRRAMAGAVPNAAVLAYNEIESVDVQPVQTARTGS